MGPAVNADAPAILTAMSRRTRLIAFLSVVFLTAQLLFVAHAGSAPDYLSDHTKQTCEFCLSAAISDDPDSLAVALDPPVFTIADVASPVAADIIVRGALIAVHSRGPPVR